MSFSSLVKKRKNPTGTINIDLYPVEQDLNLGEHGKWACCQFAIIKQVRPCSIHGEVRILTLVMWTDLPPYIAQLTRL